MRMQVILDSSFARPGSAPYGVGIKESSGTGLEDIWSKFHLEVAFGIVTGDNIDFAACVVPSNRTTSHCETALLQVFLSFLKRQMRL